MSNYFAKRFERVKTLQMDKAELLSKELIDVYSEALEHIQVDIQSFYIKYAKNNNISFAEAKKNLSSKERARFQIELKEYIRLAKQKNLSPEYQKLLKNVSIKARLSRYESLYINIVNVLENLHGQQKKDIEKLLQDIYKETTYRTAYEMHEFMPNNLDWVPNEKQIKVAIHTPWVADGKNFSDRIWADKSKLIDNIHKLTTQAFITSEPIGVTSAKLAKKMDVSYSNARRLIETESAYMAEIAMHDTLVSIGIKEYEIVATLDNRTSEICQEMDNKRFSMDEYSPGVTAPPFHVYCRSTIAPYIEDIKETRASRKDGKTKYIKNMSYKEWKESL